MNNLLDKIQEVGGFDKRDRVSSGFLKNANIKYPELVQQIETATEFLLLSPTLSKRITAIRLSVTSHPICSVCNTNNVMYNPHKTSGILFSNFCSSWCASQSQQRLNNCRKTNLARYGNEYHQLTDLGKHTRQQTNLEKYGHVSPAANNEIRIKIKQTNLEKYGNENVFGSEHGKEKIKQTNLEKYGNVSFNTSALSEETQLRLKSADWLKQQNKDGLTLYDIATILNCSVACVFQHFKQCSVAIIRQKQSHFEKQVSQWLQTMGILVTHNIKIDKVEYDIAIPNHNILIECDGIYWHGENTAGRGRSYHINKTSHGQLHGWNVIHIFENEWVEKQDIVKSLIINKLKLHTNKINARACDVQTVSYDVASMFLQKYHLQGSCKTPINIGLFSNNELMAIMTFSKKRFEQNIDGDETELVRFCVKSDINIRGGFSKMLSFAKKTYKFGQITTYADSRYSLGQVYKANGFKCVSVTPPSYHYFKTNNCLTLINRQKFQKHKLKKQLSNYDDSLSEWVNMMNNGYDRIWDCGNTKWILE